MLGELVVRDVLAEARLDERVDAADGARLALADDLLRVERLLLLECALSSLLLLISNLLGNDTLGLVLNACINQGLDVCFRVAQQSQH